MKRPKRSLLIVALVLVIIFISGMALAQNGDRQDQDIVRIGNNVIVAERQMIKDAVAVGGSVTVLREGQITGDAVAIGGDVVLKTGARVEGDAVAFGGDILKEEGVTIGGDTVTIFADGRWGMQAFRRWGVGGLLSRIYLFSITVHILVVLAVTVVGVLLMLLQPTLLQTLAATVSQQPLKSGLWGLGGAIAIMLLTTLIAGSLLGTVLLPVVHLLGIIVGLLGTLGVGLLIGIRTLRTPGQKPLAQLLIGMLILGVIGLIPIVGGLFFLAVNLFGFGSVLISRLGRRNPSDTLAAGSDQLLEP